MRLRTNWQLPTIPSSLV
ncbi:hypothetical protein Gohar_018125 [Gossypium harknessii]|uniref:Uncharacterized protein n=1 Tax=Gossypium harknessii TaxID=34285 RepID=A0A7J9G837_9ROSI|nr:hypothetical protein [Gossypium harknessii]